MTVPRFARTVRRAISDWRFRRAYDRQLAQGKPAGTVRYDVVVTQPVVPPFVEIRIPDDPSDDDLRRRAADWVSRQTLEQIVATGYERSGRVTWRHTSEESAPPPIETPWFMAPGELPEAPPTYLESALLVAASESVDAVVLFEPTGDSNPFTVGNAEAAHSLDARAWTLYRSDAYTWDPSSNELRPSRKDRLVKVVGLPGMENPPFDSCHFNRFRRGQYLSSAKLGPFLKVPLSSPPILERTRLVPSKPGVLVLAPFLARGGAEQTLFETMRALSSRIDFSIVTLAPHRAALGDRRSDFREITDRLYCLGDLVHPDAMPNILLNLVDRLGVSVIYNANGSTLFYDFAPILRNQRPELRIVDHLYDHRVGYIDRYSPTLLSSVDSCVAENHAIANELSGNRGWPSNRVSVIWPCGRADEDLPAGPTREETRARLRRQFEIGDDDVLFLMAARMHEQKRPLDAVALAARVDDLERVHFLLVGGGDLEAEVDRAIAAGPSSRIRRLAFRDDIPELILAADVGMLISEFEGLPVFLLECLQLGRPFLGTRVGDLGAVLDSTGAGVVVDRPGDLDAMETAVRRLVELDFRIPLAENALTAAARFSVNSCAEAYKSVLLGNG